MNEGLRHSNEFLEKVQTGNERLFQQAVGCALQEDKLSFSGVTKRASLQIEFGNDDEVMPLLRMADSSTVQLIGVYIEFADHKREKQEISDAALALDEALTLVPEIRRDSHDFDRCYQYIDIAKAFARLGNKEKAVEALNGLVKEGFEEMRDDNFLDVAKVLAHYGNSEGAFAVLEENKMTEAEEVIFGVMAAAAAEKGDWVKWEELTKNITIGMLVAESSFIRAKCYFSKGDEAAARDWLIKASQCQSLLSKTDSPFQPMEQAKYVDFALLELEDAGLAVEIAETMSPSLYATHSYTDIARAQFAQGDHQGALDTLNIGSERNALIIYKKKGETGEPWGTQDIAGAYMQFGNKEKGERELAKIDVDEEDMPVLIDRLSKRGNFELAIRLSSEFSGRIKSARLVGIAEDMAKQGMGSQTSQILAEATNSMAEHLENTNPEEYSKEANEARYLLGPIAKLYEKLGDHQKACQALENLFQILSSSKNEKYAWWYKNIVLDIINNYVLPVGDFDLALKAAKEYPQSSTYATIAEEFVKSGQFDRALEQLTTAEKIVNSEPDKGGGIKSEACLQISNAYCLLENSLKSKLTSKGSIA